MSNELSYEAYWVQNVKAPQESRLFCADCLPKQKPEEGFPVTISRIPMSEHPKPPRNQCSDCGIGLADSLYADPDFTL